MKKILLLMLGAIVALTSCQKDDLSSSGDGREVAVSIAASLPTVITRSSDQGGIDNVNWSEVSLRYTMEIYDGETVLPVSNEKDAATQRVLYKESAAEARAVAFDGIRLLSGKEYQFVIWADFVNKNDKSELHYTTANGLNTITEIGEARKGNDDSRDAYFSTKKIKVDKSLTQSISLVRPFGKLRVITTDVNLVHKTIETDTEATVTYKTEMPTGFNAFDGTVSSTVTVPAAYTAKIEELTKETATLAFDYMFVPATTSTSPVQVPIQFNVECQGATYEFQTDAVKLERNKLTTVKGKLLTRGVNIDITIKDEFDPPAIDIEEVASIDDVQPKLNNKAADGLPIAILVSKSVLETSTIVIPEAMVVSTTPVIDMGFEGGVAAGKTLTIKDEVPSVPYEGEIYISVPASKEADVVVDMSAATVYVNGEIKTLSATGGLDNRLTINGNAWINTFNINAGDVIVYGWIEEKINKAEGYNGTIVRGVSSSNDMGWAMNGITKDPAYDYAVVEHAWGEIDGRGYTLTKQLVVSTNVAIKNMTIDNDSKLPAFKIAGSNLDVKLSDVTIKQSVEGRCVEISDAYSNISLGIYNSNIIIPNAKQYGVIVTNASDVRVTIDGTHIAPQKEIMGDFNTDYSDDQIAEFKKRSGSRSLNVADSKNVTVNIKNSVLEGSMYALYTLNSDFVTINIDGSTLDGRAALEIGNTYKEAIADNKSVYNITNSKLIGRNYFTGTTEEYGTIVFYDVDTRVAENNYVYLTDSEIYCFNNPTTEYNHQYAALIRPDKYNLLSFKNVTITDHSQRLDYVVKIKSDKNEFKHENVTINGKEGVTLLNQVTE